ncbi:hypothetical protein DASC09_063490 [Saccharomycopsis crataegensis]|uniref:Mannosyl-oligosaccharide glucosidase n=1 Tax=Saccharomycopsis crataegensis TaxID=43959 RepID=A0AAV5QVM8_9ASCO|nr:hypothetical protein DASC09_063490 [Saccharomycopsis crataegensis]
MTIFNGTAEDIRLEEDRLRKKYWKRWGPYLGERQWATVREDYSHDGNAWSDFTFEDSRSRVYRWGEDGLAGVADSHQLVCFSIALWNENDDILKEKAYGVGGPQGNHGEDVKEYYFYLDNVPTHSYMKYLYKYPHKKFPYEQLIKESTTRSRLEREFELKDTGIFDDDNYFDILFELAKDDEDPEVLNFRITAYNRGDQPAPLHVLPQVFFRNTWGWNTIEEENRPKPHLQKESAEASIKLNHWKFGERRVVFAPSAGISKDVEPKLLFTDNETNKQRLYKQPNEYKYVKDAFHDYIIEEDESVVNPKEQGTKACAWFAFDENGGIPPGDHVTIRYKFYPVDEANKSLVEDIDEEEFDELFGRKQDEADKFYWRISPLPISPELRKVQRQAFSGLLWSKQYYQFIWDYWFNGDRGSETKPPKNRANHRNSHWQHLYCDEVLSMPDKWEYPFFASWDTCFHCIPLTMIDPEFAKNQIEIFLKEWYQHPNGACPSYEWSFDDLNPPVFAWSAFRVYKLERKMHGRQDKEFLERVFHKLLLNFTWWINRKDSDGNNVFEGGFLGLDNIGIFNRSEPLPTGGVLEQADSTGWMAFYSLQMLNIALELARDKKVYEHIASKFFEHFLLIADAMTYKSEEGDKSLWDESDKFYYDAIKYPDGYKELLPVRSLVGLIPLYASLTIEPEWLQKFPGFKHRLDFLLERRSDIAKRNIASTTERGVGERLLLALVNKERLKAILEKMLDEDEFLSHYGIRSLSKYHEAHPFSKVVHDQKYEVKYLPGESDSGLFGGNSNWRGPIWFPVNFLLVESLQRFYLYYGNTFQVECPKGSGNMMNLAQVAEFIQHRLIRIFVPDSMDVRACNDADNDLHNYDPYFKDYVLFYEYFDGDTGRGLGASHQCGWTALVAKLIHDVGISCVTTSSPKTPRTITAQYLDEEGLFKETASPFSSKLMRRRSYKSSANLMSSGYGSPTKESMGLFPISRRHTLHSDLGDENQGGITDEISNLPPTISRRSTISAAQDASRDKDLFEQIRNAIQHYNLKRETGEDDVSSDELEAQFQ